MSRPATTAVRWRSVISWSLAVGMGGCSAGAPGSTEPVAWPIGRYEVRGVVEYQDDTEYSNHTRTLPVSAELEVTKHGPLLPHAVSGPCRLAPDADPELTNAHGRRSFVCGDTRLTFEARPSEMRAVASMSVFERVRSASGCEEYTTASNGSRRCIRRAYRVRSRRVDRTGTLRVIRIGSS
jgi:hypothetical protein